MKKKKRVELIKEGRKGEDRAVGGNGREGRGGHGKAKRVMKG